MILSRRIPRPTQPSTKTPSESGPRWMIMLHIRRTSDASTTAPASLLTIPAIPHIGLIGPPASIAIANWFRPQNLPSLSLSSYLPRLEIPQNGGQSVANSYRLATTNSVKRFQIFRSSQFRGNRWDHFCVSLEPARSYLVPQYSQNL